MEKEFSIAAIVVTFNRLDKLKIALKAYESQEWLPKRLIVVNNCSTDGTNEYLEQWMQEESPIKKTVETLPSNMGGAGGFQRGFELFLQFDDCNWAWVADDDAYPDTLAMKILKEYYESLDFSTQEEIAALSSAVVNKDEIHKEHRNHIKQSRFRWRIVSASLSEYCGGPFDFDLFSYVGALIKKTTLQKVGITRGDYFIYGDDQEHSLRISNSGRLVCVPDSLVVHDTDGFGVRPIGWGHYYHVRNNLITRKTHLRGRHFWLSFIKGYIRRASILSGNDEEVRTLYKNAYLDALHLKTGIHDVYQPGFELRK